MVPDSLHRAWDAARTALGLPADDRALDDLAARYREPHRVYHALDHIRACLTMLDAHRDEARRPHEVALAILFHDAVYDPLRSDNEAQSAALMRRVLAGADTDSLARVERMILATASHGDSDDIDVRLLVDIDLSILGAAPGVYASFERAIEAEYAAVPRDVFRAGRRWLLERFLEGGHVFRTASIHARLEARARANLEGRIAELAGPA